jgi:uncharacterized protein (DUF427 family)
MGLAWQQGPLADAAVGRFLVPGPLPERLLYAEPLRRRMRVRFGETWLADSDDVVLLHEPGRYPVAYFPLSDVSPDVLEASEHTTRHRDLGTTSWFTVRAGSQSKPDVGDAHRAAWSYLDAWPEVGRVAGCVSFEPDKIEVSRDGKRLRLEPGQSVVPHGIDRNLNLDEVPGGTRP